MCMRLWRSNIIFIEMTIPTIHSSNLCVHVNDNKQLQNKFK